MSLGNGDDELATRFGAVRLVERFGEDDAFHRTTWCIEQAAREVLTSYTRGGGINGR